MIKNLSEIRECTSDIDWDEFQKNSIHSSVYMTSNFLNCLSIELKKVFYILDGKTVASAVINTNPYYMFPYQGVSICEFQDSLNSQITKSFKVLSDFLNLLSIKYKKLIFSLSYNLSDLRPFQWINYNEDLKGRFKINLNYTAIISSKEYCSFNEYLYKIRTVRRQEWNKCKKNNFFIESSNKEELFIDIYSSMFANKSISLDNDHINRVKNILSDAIKNNYGDLTFCYDENGNVHSTNLILYYKTNAYYQFGATYPEYRSSGATSFLLLENIRKFFEKGYSNFDMVGINSPNRGDFKLSFNALPIPYFDVEGEFIFN
jgi:hypothetical protein